MTKCKRKTAFQAVMANGRLACSPGDRPEALSAVTGKTPVFRFGQHARSD
jgi:hypothetical protein